MSNAKTVEEVLAEFNQGLESEYGVQLDSVELKEVEQRSDQWHRDRLGLFTGSCFGKLMTCKSRAKGKDWGTKLWLMDFGDTALTYIIERAIERVTGQRIETPTTWQMRWGTEHEDEGREYTEEVTGDVIEEVSFIKFLKNAGASADGKILTNNVVYGYELKCPATVQSHYKLMTTPVAEGHDYFWQTTGEMLSLETDRLMFATYDPRYPEATRLDTQIVQLSELHANALVFRCIVAEKLVEALMVDMKVNLRLKLAEIGQGIPDDREGLFEWLENEKKGFEV